MSAARYDAIVIGAGSNGLAAASMLGRKHRKVLLLERSSTLGGMARMIEIAPGFSAPLGPDSGWVSTRTASAIGMRVPASTKPTVSFAVRADDRFFSLPVDTVAATQAIRARSTRDAERWPALIARLHHLSGFLEALYASPPPDIAATSIADLASLLGLGRRFRALGREDMMEILRVLPMPIKDFLDDELEDETLKAGIAAGGVRDLRQGPYSGSTAFVLLHYLMGASAGSARARDWWTESPTALVTALEEHARKRNVEIRTGSQVARITVRNERVHGVVLANGDELEAPIVVSTADPRRTLLELADPVWLDPELLNSAKHIKLRGCTAIVHFAMESLPASGLSNADWASIISLSPTMSAIERSYDAVKYRASSSEPHVELTAASLRWPKLAPEGRHVVIARAQYAASDDTNGNAFADKVTQTIERAIPGFGNHVLHRRVSMPKDLEAEFALSEGAMTHGEILLDQILFMRPLAGLARYETPIGGLFLGGAGSHPGPGLPGAAGAHAARAALS